ncbi:hypothetical protein [Haloechinothrix halophila]|uniref:hypothetical protein n=1 Tax=Haloechinothrix halophila TaxID=1069073 RepID=UPI0005594D26|nr:hypothetical protein [Haloechinothrix halophila]
MTGFGVGSESLRDAAKAAGDAADQVGAMELSIGATLNTALPGSRASGLAANLDTHLGDEKNAWQKAMGDYRDNLNTAADRYDSDEQAAEQDFDGMRPR